MLVGGFADWWGVVGYGKEVEEKGGVEGVVDGMHLSKSWGENEEVYFYYLHHAIDNVRAGKVI